MVYKISILKMLVHSAFRIKWDSACKAIIACRKARTKYILLVIIFHPPCFSWWLLFYLFLFFSWMISFVSFFLHFGSSGLFHFLLSYFTFPMFMCKMRWRGALCCHQQKVWWEFPGSHAHGLAGSGGLCVPGPGWDRDGACSLLLSSLARERKRRISEKGLRWK